MAVTAVPRVSQWAEMHRIALGRGMASAISRQVRVTVLVSSATVGLPWPKKTTGMVGAAVEVMSAGQLVPPCATYRAKVVHRLSSRRTGSCTRYAADTANASFGLILMRRRQTAGLRSASV